ncbi:MAG TPA: hypothetical protein DCS42_03470 [Nitrospiraceae bacterium]|nr:hypothetical protein [Nitrospiraceae bacterium]
MDALRAELQGLNKFLHLEKANLDILRGKQVGPAEVDGLLAYYLKTILSLTHTTVGSILIRDGDQFVFRAARGPGAQKLIGKRIPESEGIIGGVAKSGKAHLSVNVRGNRRRSSINESTGNRPRNILAAPIRNTNGVIGVIELIKKSDGNPFTAGDKAMIEFLAGRLSLDMEYADLLAGSQREARHRVMQMKLSTVLNSTLDQREVRRRAMEAATALMDADVGSLLLVDEKTGDLFFEVALGEKGSRLKEIRLKMGEGIAGWVAAKDQPALVNDVENDRRYFRQAGVITKFVTRNMVCVPVRSKGKVVGVLQAINKKGGGAFTEEDLENFMTLSHQVAVALENAHLYGELKETFVNTAAALAAAVEKKDPYTGGHIKRVVEYSSAIARCIEGDAGDLEQLRLAAVLHDIGKIGIRDSVLLKQAGFTPDELETMRSHPLVGADILAHIEQMGEVRRIMRSHHEKWNGSGYPDGLAGEAIPLHARIISVADAFDAITTDRPYRKAAGLDAAKEEIRRHGGTEFDPLVVAAFVEACETGDILISKE